MELLKYYMFFKKLTTIISITHIDISVQNNFLFIMPNFKKISIEMLVKESSQ